MGSKPLAYFASLENHWDSIPICVSPVLMDCLTAVHEYWDKINRSNDATFTIKACGASCAQPLAIVELAPQILNDRCSPLRLISISDDSGNVITVFKQRDTGIKNELQHELNGDDAYENRDVHQLGGHETIS